MIQINKTWEKSGWAEEAATQEEYLTRLLIRCGHTIQHQRELQTEQGQTQDRVLQILAEGAMSQKDLQERLQIRPGSMSELISKLESKRMVTRKRDEEDKRRVILEITRKGYHVTKQTLQPDKKEWYRCLTDEEKTEFARILGKLLDDWDHSEEKR